MVAEAIVFLDEKGGVAKTTTTKLISQDLNSRDYKVCAIDMDGQCNFTMASGIPIDTKKNIYTVLRKESDAIDSIVSTDSGDILPGSPMMKNWEAESAGLKDSMIRLGNRLEPIKEYYDFMLFDTPPFLGTSTSSTLLANKKIFVVIPTTPNDFGVMGVIDTIEDIEAIKDSYRIFGVDIQIAGIVITQVNRGSSLSRKSIKQKEAREAVKRIEEIAEKHGTRVFDQYLYVNQQYIDFVAKRENVFTSTKYDIPKKEIRRVTDELLEVIGKGK